MKIAILLTGELRTIEKTLIHFKNNIVDNLDCDVYCVLQPNKDGTGNDISYYEKYVKEILGDKCKKIHVFYRNDWLFNAYQTELLDNFKNKLPNNWINYLRTSGSMIEYYQLWLAYNDMVKYEMINNIRYDYIIRFRTDLYWNDKLNFDWLNISENEIRNRINLFVNNDKNITNKELLAKIMVTIISEKQLKNMIDDLVNEYNPLDDEYLNSNDKLIDKLLNIDYNSKEYELLLKEFILNGKYILTFRKNLIYFVSRNNFDLIPLLGITYGYYGSKEINGNYWFNAESQFSEICKNKGLSIFDYHTNIDNESLYNYEYSSKVIDINDPRLLYAIIRK